VDGSYAPVSSTTRTPRLAAHHAVVGLGGADFGFARLYGLQREGRVLKLLRSEGMPVPEVIAACENPNVVVMEHVDGLSDFTLIESAEERDQIARQFAAIMAKWHAIPAQKLVEIGFAMPNTRDDYIVKDLEVWEQRHFPLRLPS
jgi:aminoglycoside phosphotransferase (APT) family kinase protein